VLGAIALKEAGEFVYHGRRFKASGRLSAGYQLSPFKDGTKTSAEATVVNVATGKRLSYSLLVPDMVERDGVYEGTGSGYRVDPHDIVAVLDFLEPRDKRR